MTTTFWTGNGIAQSQVETCTVATAVTGGTLSATINGKTLTYTCLASDTTITAATAFFNLLSATTTAPSEFNQITWTNPSNGVVVATATNPGTPFAGMTNGLIFSAAAGATITQAHTTPNASPSDAFAAANWLRNNGQSLPQNGDDIVLANSSVPILYNIDQLANIRLNSFTRWQSFTASVGLPENNVNGYYEYLPTYFKLSGPLGGTLKMTLGYGPNGGGPTRERYDAGSQQVLLNVLASGSPTDDYAVRFLGSNPANVLNVVGTSAGVAMLPAETSSLNTATIDGGGSLDLGAGVSFPGASSSSGSPGQVATPAGGAVTYNNSSGTVNCAPGTLNALNGASVIAAGLGLNYTTVVARLGSTVTWLSDSNIGNLVMTASSTLDKSGDLRPILISSSTIDADTCFINDPNNAIAYGTPTVCNGQSTSGPFIFGPGRKVQLS